MKNPVPRLTAIILLGFLVGLLSACTSAEELVQDGAQLEAEGRYEEAVRKYIAAYDKDPSIIDLHDRVTELGNRVVDDRLGEADAAMDAGLFVRAAESYMQIDDLVLRALEAGIVLERPSGYADDRFEAFRRAVRVLQETALDAYNQGDLAAADGIFRDALDRFDPTPEETHELLVGRHNVLLALADQATAAAAFREAVSRADEAVAVAEQAGISAESALAIRARAIDLGTLYVAATPVRGWDRGEHAVSPWILAELNDRLELDYWSKPPDFVAMAHGALVRQRIRSLGFGRRPLSRGEARILASDLNAHLVVLTEIERFDWSEEVVEERVRRATIHRGRDVAFTETKMRVDYRSVIRIEIVARNGDVIYDDHIEDNIRREIKRADYDGDWRDLDLSRGDRELFDPDEFDEFLAELEEDLVERVTSRTAERVFDRVVREVR